MTKPKTGKKKPGVPKGVQAKRIDLDADQIKLCEKYSGIGLNLDHIAYLIGVHPRTLDNIIKRQPEVAYAIKKGEAMGIAKVTSKLFGMIDNASHKNHFSAVCFFMKCKGKWVEARDQGESIKEDPYEPPDSIVDDDDD